MLLLLLVANKELSQSVGNLAHWAICGPIQSYM